MHATNATRPAVQAALFSGARYSEIASLRAQDFDAVSGTILIAQSKSGRSRRVYLDSEACEFFQIAAKRRKLTSGCSCGMGSLGVRIRLRD